ncbi:hypothetical protein NIASO_01880 [Niabella soli DSM 19437]|uniref:Uncharacterized protein n=1 Tax=Niabella soli DSM 19437 TaxID=929713 RepID=W0F6M6_9BACT|nr:hypothetical protein NIASO_01880 [Niabella soli DSM 19437]
MLFRTLPNDAIYKGIYGRLSGSEEPGNFISHGVVQTAICRFLYVLSKKRAVFKEKNVSLHR